MALTISQIALYPVKSLAGSYPSSAELVESGLRLDRNWMIVDQNGAFLTQRQHPRMARIAVAASDELLRLAVPGAEPLDVPAADDGSTRSVEVWGDRCEAVDQGAPAAELLSDYLGRRCRLVRMKRDFRRELKRSYRSSPQMQLSFADSAPLLLISEASLADLNERLDAPVRMNRFRPNLVVAGGSAYQEDQWARISIGGLRFRVARDCIRCEITTVEQESGEKGIEPLETLEAYRSGPRGPRFGRKLVQESLGTIRLGDRVDVLE